MASNAALTERLTAFKNNFSKLLGKKHQGYDQLSTNLLAEGADDDSRQHSAGGGGGYQGPVPGYETHATDAFGTSDRTTSAPVSTNTHVPSQAEEIVALASLAKEAAELLWELVVMEDSGDSLREMKEKAADLQAQLRGLIGDYQDSDEAALAVGLEAFDTLNNVLEAEEETGNPNAAGPSAAYPQPAAPVAQQEKQQAASPPPAVPADEPPLIEF